jgi:hypothetical protein
MNNPPVVTRTFFPPPMDLFHFPHVRKPFRSLEGDLLHSQMPEKSSGSWYETFYIPPCHKGLVPGVIQKEHLRQYGCQQQRGEGKDHGHHVKYKVLKLKWYTRKLFSIGRVAGW